MGSLLASKGVAAVLLDAGGTLMEAHPAPEAVYAEVLSRWGPAVTAEEVGPIFSAVWAAMTQEHPRGLDRYHTLKGGEKAWWGEFLRRVLLQLGHPAPWREVLEELFATFARPERWRLYPEVLEVLGQLASRGVRLAVVSNWDSRLPFLLSALGVTPLVDAVVVSALEGVEKPNPEIFFRALARLGVKPEGAVHWGDSPLDDVRGAESAGIAAILVDRHQLFGHDGGLLRARDLREAYELTFG